ncbi:MAG: ABC transporter permease [Anaerolineae bacterium]|nr:ABC transporter permease [Anaerolineae bacterium]
MTALETPTTTPEKLRVNPIVQSLRRLLGSQEGILVLVLLVLMAVVGASNPRFLSQNNLTDVFAANAYLAVAAIGMSMVIISGNIDISVGALVGVMITLSGNLAVGLAGMGWPLWLVIAISWAAPLAVGMLVGAINGFFVAYLRIPSIVVTLGMFSILKGGLILVAGGNTIYNLPPGYTLAQQSVLDIPVTIYFMVILTIIAFVWLRYSATGRAIYAVGGNAEAARLSGINPRRIVMTAFVLNGLMVGVCGLMLATQFNQIQATAPPGLELFVITASVVGGVSILGGTGTVIGSTLASVLVKAIGSAMLFINVSPYWLKAVQGTLILITVLADILRRRRQSRQ